MLNASVMLKTKKTPLCSLQYIYIIYENQDCCVLFLFQQYSLLLRGPFFFFFLSAVNRCSGLLFSVPQAGRRLKADFSYSKPEHVEPVVETL